MMAKFSGDTRYCILTENAPAAAANELNTLLFAAGIEEKFITLSLSVLDVENRTLTLASAGHLPILVRRAGGTVEEVGEEIAGFPLGIIPESDYQQTEVKLDPGDVVAVFSDGVTDARNLREELYDSRENRRLLRKFAESPGGPEAVGRAILQDIREFSAGHVQVDDITLICFGAACATPVTTDGWRSRQGEPPCDRHRNRTELSSEIHPAMSIRVANIRLELGEPEEALPEKIAARLGLGTGEIASWRILRKSLDARRHDDLHFAYAAEVELADDADAADRPRTRSPDVAAVLAGALRLARAGHAAAATSAGDRRRGARRAVRRLSAGARRATGP